MISFTYADNSAAVSKALAAFEQSLADEAPALQAIADDFRQMIAQQFSSEGRAEGTPWAPRKSSGVRAMLRSPSGAGQAPPLLVRTGALLASLTEPNSPDHVEETNAESLTLGTRVPYAMFHQLGTRRMPARPIIVVSGERTERWVEIVRSRIEEQTLLLGANELK